MDLETFFYPLEDRILISLNGDPEETESGIYLPEGVSDGRGRGKTGVAKTFGPECSSDVADEGDTVLFQENIGRDLPLGDGEHVLVREANILAVLPN
jgi:co-chaperonin GroES (HSP10)